VLATHGRTSAMVRWLQEQGIDAAPLQTEYVGERDDLEVDSADAADTGAEDLAIEQAAPAAEAPE
jgi:putative mRNA 3-end processing factor